MSTKRRIISITAGLLLLSGCDKQTPAAPDLEEELAPSFAVTHNFHRDYGPYRFYNPCAGEWVEYSYSAHIVQRSTSDGAGGHQWGHNINRHGQGVGLTTGDTYVFNRRNGLSVHSKPPFPKGFNFNCYWKFITKGSSPNVLMHFQEHVTINANGDVTIEDREPVFQKCVG